MLKNIFEKTSLNKTSFKNQFTFFSALEKVGHTFLLARRWSLLDSNVDTRCRGGPGTRRSDFEISFFFFSWPNKSW